MGVIVNTMFPTTLPECGLKTCLLTEPCYHCDQPHDMCECSPTSIQKLDLAHHLTLHNDDYTKPPRIKYHGNYATFNGQGPKRIISLQTLNEIGGHLPAELKQPLFDAHLKATGQDVTPKPPTRLDPHTLKQLLTGGLDDESELGIILPAFGDSGLVWGSTATGKSRFLRWVTTHHLTHPDNTATILLGEDLTGWAAWALHHHQTQLEDRRLTLIDWVGKGPIFHPETSKQLTLELSSPLKGGGEKLLKPHSQNPSLLVVDPASRFVEDEDRKIEVVAFWETLSKLFPQSRRIVAHHATKSRDNPTPSGSAEWGNSPSVIWHLKGGETHRLITTKRRSGNLPDMLTYKTRSWGIQLDSPEDRIRAFEDRIVTSVRDMGGASTLTAIRRSTGIDDVSRTLLDKLVDQGRLAYKKQRGSKYGSWFIPPIGLPDPY